MTFTVRIPSRFHEVIPVAIATHSLFPFPFSPNTPISDSHAHVLFEMMKAE